MLATSFHDIGDTTVIIRALLCVAFVGGISTPLFADSAIESPIGRQVSDFTLSDYLGAKHSLSDWKEKQAVVVVFLGTECPLVKLYGPRLEEMANAYAEKGVQFVGINSNRQDTLEEIGHYARLHKITFPMLKDAGNKVADEFGATRTPEAYVLDRAGTIRYAGRIDDQYGVGYAKGKVVQSDLAAALDEVLSGKLVTNSQTKAVGCFIGKVGETTPSGEITYTKHIAPIFNDRCVRCHRAGEVAPFALTSYDDIVGWGDTIAEVIRDERMPPWHANPSYGKFSNDARLPDAQRQLVYDWVEHGMPEGDPADLPPAPQFVDGWQIDKPDVVLKMPKPFTVPAHGTVEYKYFVLDEPVKEDMWIRAAEMRPGNRAVVHHLILFYVTPEQARHHDGNALANGIATFAPGMPPLELPEDLALRVPAGSRLVFQCHYTPNGTEQSDQSEVGIVFADKSKVKHELIVRAGMNHRFKIPPGDSNYRVEKTERINKDSLLYSLTPHMHVRGKSFRFTAHYPDGSEEILLDVPRYDFNWQNIYKLAEPKRLPKGTEIQMVAHYDNSADNPSNPDPTKTVGWGDQTWEEMMIGSASLVEEGEELHLTDDRRSESTSSAAESGGGE